MNAPASEQKNEEGGMLVAALAGGAILLAVALVVFSGGDDADGKGDAKSASASASANGSKTGGSGSTIKARKVDDANAEDGDGRVNDPNAASSTPAKAHRTTRATSEGMAAAPVDKGPPKFETKEDELKWWNRQLEGAQRLKVRREGQIAKLPEMEAKISEAVDQEAARESFEKKRERLELALQRSHDQIAELEAKIAAL